MTNHTIKTAVTIAAIGYAGIFATEIAIIDRLVRGKLATIELALANQTNHS